MFTQIHKSALLVVIDVNDNQPTFLHLPYSADVNEVSQHFVMLCQLAYLIGLITVGLSICVTLFQNVSIGMYICVTLFQDVPVGMSICVTLFQNVSIGISICVTLFQDVSIGLYMCYTVSGCVI